MTIPGRLGDDHLQGLALEAMATCSGPRKVLVSLGLSGLGRRPAGTELAENSGLTVGADPSVIFDTPVEKRHTKAPSAPPGLEAWMLSPTAGHA